MSVVTIQAIIDQLKTEMQAVGLWDKTPPAPEKLLSTAPFAVDQLDFHQWLQFVFIPEFEQRIRLNQTLPHGFSISPMAEESWRGKWSTYRKVILALKALEAHLPTSL